MISPLFHDFRIRQWTILARNLSTVEDARVDLFQVQSGDELLLSQIPENNNKTNKAPYLTK
jgi:hypothetical protein